MTTRSMQIHGRRLFESVDRVTDDIPRLVSAHAESAWDSEARAEGVAIAARLRRLSELASAAAASLEDPDAPRACVDNPAMLGSSS